MLIALLCYCYCIVLIHCIVFSLVRLLAAEHQILNISAFENLKLHIKITFKRTRIQLPTTQYIYYSEVG